MSASKWKPYPESKPSEIEGIGDIPFHWRVVRAKQLERNSLELVQTGPFGAQLHASDYIEDEVKGVPLILIKNVNQLKIHSNDIPRISPEKANQLSLYRLKSGDIVFSRVGSVGRIARVSENEEGWLISGQMLRLRFATELLDSDYSLFLISSRSIQTYFELQSVGTTRDSINSTILSEMPLTIPPIGEQRAIASFCRTFAEQIDNAICNLENLMKKIEQKRSALMRQAITKGLNLAVPMKDSGIDWIGDLPQHWDSKKVKFVSKIFRGKFGHRPRNDPKLYDGHYPFVQTGNVARASKYITEYTQTLNDLGRSVSEEFPSGTIVMAIAANIGDVAILTFDACFPDSIVGFNPNPDINQEYLYYSLNALASELDKVASQSTQQNLNIELVGNLMIPVPPETEQIVIGKYISEIEQTSSHSIEKIEILISKLVEYRTALISAAVAGKIDLRRWIRTGDSE